MAKTLTLPETGITLVTRDVQSDRKAVETVLKHFEKEDAIRIEKVLEEHGTAVAALEAMSIIYTQSTKKSKLFGTLTFSKDGLLESLDTLLAESIKDVFVSLSRVSGEVFLGAHALNINLLMLAHDMGGTLAIGGTAVLLYTVISSFLSKMI